MERGEFTATKLRKRKVTETNYILCSSQRKGRRRRRTPSVVILCGVRDGPGAYQEEGSLANCNSRFGFLSLQQFLVIHHCTEGGHDRNTQEGLLNGCVRSKQHRCHTVIIISASLPVWIHGGCKFQVFSLFLSLLRQYYVVIVSIWKEAFLSVSEAVKITSREPIY